MMGEPRPQQSYSQLRIIVVFEYKPTEKEFGKSSKCGYRMPPLHATAGGSKAAPGLDRGHLVVTHTSWIGGVECRLGAHFLGDDERAGDALRQAISSYS